MSKLDDSKRASVRPSDLLAAAAAIAAGTQAYAEVIIFINPPAGEPGHFGWSLGDEFDATVWLDITRPATDQGGFVGPSSVGQFDFYPGYFPITYNITSNGASVVGEGNFTSALPAGMLIDGQLNFYSHSTHGMRDGSTGSVFSLFHPEIVAYMGVRFSDVDGYHYGWIAAEQHSTGHGPSLHLNAFAWGYEAQPGVPIVAGIPAPGTLAALAFGAALTSRRRNRKNN
jgi:hypothetical protein